MRNPWKLTSFALASALAVSFIPAVGADPQPKMRDALDHLQNAERALQNAAHDKGGHRAKALEALRQSEETTFQQELCRRGIDPAAARRGGDDRAAFHRRRRQALVRPRGRGGGLPYYAIHALTGAQC